MKALTRNIIHVFGYGYAGVCLAEPLISNGDFVIGLDEDIVSNSSYPGAEGPVFVIDGTETTKYLNFGRQNSGFIVTPTLGASIVKSFSLTTANDAEERDPAEVTIYGTNEAVASTDNSGGRDENWTEIAVVPLTLPIDRQTSIIPINVINDTSYSSYKIIFSQLKGPNGGLAAPNSMQIAEMQMWDAADGAGAAILAAGDPILAVHAPSFQSSSPAAEGPANLFDGDTATKYLNFGIVNSGFIVTPSSGPSVATSFVVSTANDFESRDPVDWELYGTNDDIVSLNNEDGIVENWVAIANGSLELPVERLAAGPEVFFANAAIFTSYKWIVRSVRDPLVEGTDSVQFSEFQLFSGGSGGAITITGITRNPLNGEVTIAWDAPSNGIYTLQSSPDLSDWSTIITSDLTIEENSSYTFSMDGISKAFLRVIPTPTF